MSPALVPPLAKSPFVLPDTLSDDPVVLKTLLWEQQAEIRRCHLEIAAIEQRVEARMEARIQQLYEQLLLSRRKQFGPSSESHAGQGWLFDEAEATVANSPADEDEERADLKPTSPTVTDSPKRRGKRLPLPAELPRIEVVHDVPETERICACGTPMVEIGEEVSEQLDIVPMQIRVLRHVRKRYGCPKGEHAPVVAPVPPQVLPKSNASFSVLAMLLVIKFVDGLPLARFEHVLARSGVLVSRQTLARWVIGCAQALQPVFNLLRDALLDSSVIHMDETTVQVLKEPGRAATTSSYMWVQKGGPPGRPVVVFDYDPSRSGQVPVRLLEGWRGYLMTDGYEGYCALVNQGGIQHLSCWVHARRRFVEAAKVQKKGKSGRADQALAFIARLYAIEKSMREASVEERFRVRQAESLPVLAELRRWLDETLPLVPPKTALGEALGYLQKYWPRLIRYTERGDLPIDNNPAENAIRPFVVGRKAWLFCDTPAGAEASALIYSLIETAKANGVEPYTWLCRVLRQLPLAQSVDDYEALLPWNLHPGNLITEAAI